jgi:hypothetical protein
MKLTYQEILKLKGRYLKDAKGEILHVTSATKNKVVLNKGMTFLTSIFMNKHQSKFEFATDEEVTKLMEGRYHEFLDDNEDVIDALANTRKYSFWGGNGKAMAEDDLLKTYQPVIDFDFVDQDKVQQERFDNN